MTFNITWNGEKALVTLDVDLLHLHESGRTFEAISLSKVAIVLCQAYFPSESQKREPQGMVRP